MRSDEYSLGELEHIHNNQNLKLRTNVLISLSSCDPVPLCFTHDGDLETLISSGIWIVGGNRVQTHIQLLFEGLEISDLASENITEDIGLMLSDAEVLLSGSQSCGVTHEQTDLVTTSSQCISESY